jgi:phasin family protein
MRWAAFLSAGRLLELNRTAAQTAIDEQRAVTMKAAEERSPLGAWRLQASYTMAGAKLVAYWRHACEIILDAYAEAVADAESHLNQGFLTMTGALEDATIGVASSIVTGDPARATASMEETASIVEPRSRPRSAGSR